MELKDLVGRHMLSGVEMGLRRRDTEAYEDAQTISFVLDGKTYTAIENPEDGYRSSMRELIEDEGFVVKNTFYPHQVIALFRGKCDVFDYEEEILDFFDGTSGLCVLSVGTNYYEDYYPMFVAEWTPENLWENVRNRREL